MISLKNLCLAAGCVILISFVGYTLINSQNKMPVNGLKETASKPTRIKKVDSQRIRLLAAGDFLAHDSVNTNAKQTDGSYNYLPMVSNFEPIFQAADIRFCNDGNLNGGAQFGISGYPKFNSPPEFVVGMAKLGCNMINTATNHSFDRNQAAIDASVDTWAKQVGMLAVVGENKNQAQHDQIHIFNVKGVKFAFLAYTSYLNSDAPAQNDYGVNVYSNDFAASQIRQARAAGVQIIIVSIRWGVEYSMEVSAAQKQTAQFLANQGVNLVLGHGSHILEPVQRLNGANGIQTVVWYSLGNFLNTQLPPETLFNGLAIIDFDKTTHQISNLSFLPIYMHYEWTAAQSKAQDLAARHSLKMLFLDNATQSMVDAQQLNTTIDAQRKRLSSTLNTFMVVPFVTQRQYEQ